MSPNERRMLIAAAAAIGLTMTPADAARLVEPTGFAEMRQLVEAHPEIEQAIFPGLSAAPLLMGGKKAGLRVQDVFNTSLWTGTGSARTITTGIDSGEGSLAWLKNRSSTTRNQIFDTYRGASNLIESDTTNANFSGSGVLTAFLASGYSLDASSSGNASGQNYVGWQFRRAPKFLDIVQYTGNGVGGRQISHDLGVKPGMMIFKRLDTTQNWAVYHQARPATEFGSLNLTNAFASSPNFWNNTEPTDTNFTLGTSIVVNANGGAYIAYLFAHDPSPEGFIQCGSFLYSGGASVTTGWRPQYIIYKRTDGTSDWAISDKERFRNLLFANDTIAEASLGSYISFTSTGFEIASGFLNNGNYLYMAIREAA